MIRQIKTSTNCSKNVEKYYKIIFKKNIRDIFALFCALIFYLNVYAFTKNFSNLKMFWLFKCIQNASNWLIIFLYDACLFSCRQRAFANERNKHSNTYGSIIRNSQLIKTSCVTTTKRQIFNNFCQQKKI